MDGRRPRAVEGEQTWELRYLEAAAGEARKILDDDHYRHVVEQFDVLACEPDPRRPATQDVKKIEDFFELREKGGRLRNINLRVYFSVEDEHNTIVVLCVYKKEDEGRAPVRITKRVKVRLKHARAVLGEAVREVVVKDSRRRNQ